MLHLYLNGNRRYIYIFFFVFQVIFIFAQIFIFMPCMNYSNGWIKLFEYFIDKNEETEYTTEQYFSSPPDQIKFSKSEKSIVTNDEEIVHDEPSWFSLDKRKTPTWFTESKIGVIINWGPYSVPSFSEYGGSSDWFWYYWQNEKYVPPSDKKRKKEYFNMKKQSRHAIDSIQNYAKRRRFRDYSDLILKFRAELFDPQYWLSVIERSGAQSVIFTSKNHDGFANWGSKYSWNWNSIDGGPLRDLVGELEEAVRSHGLKFGIYYSLFEWFHPLYTNDKVNKFQTQFYIRERVMPELTELVSVYKPDILWVDGHWEASCSYWNCTNFLDWLYNESPVKEEIVTNDRWGEDVVCQHGDFNTCDEYYNPDMQEPAENWAWTMTIDRESSGYRRNAELKDYSNMDEIIEVLVKTISNGGNIFFNIGATSDGLIMPILEERLLNLGKWLEINGEAIFDTVPWHTAQDSLNKDIFYTKKVITNEDIIIYAIVLQWPRNDWLPLGSPKLDKITSVSWLGYNGNDTITWEKGPAGFNLKLPQITMNEIPCKWAWVLKFTNLTNSFDSDW